MLFGKKKEDEKLDIPKPSDNSQTNELPKLELPKFEDIGQPEEHSGGYEETQHDELPDLGTISSKPETEEVPQQEPPVEPQQELPPQEPPRQESFAAPPVMDNSSSERPLFVRIDDFKDAMKKVDNIKESLAKTDEILSKLENIKAEEETEFKAWHEDIKKIKDKVMDIDNILFETKR
jgi:hypothetical protein